MLDVFELIQQFCPDGVEYRRLGDVCRIEKGRTPIQNAVSGQYPLVVTADDRLSCNSFQFDSCAVCIPLISSKGHGKKDIRTLHYQTGRFALGNILCAVIPNDAMCLDARFLYEYLQFRKDILLVPLMRGGANVSLPMDLLGKVIVPVPPLPVQQEIVRILDSFDIYCNDMTAGLAGELVMRRKQFQYWREKLLTFDDTVERKALGEVAVSLSKQVLSEEKLLSDGMYPVMNSSRGLYGRYSDYNNDGNAIVIASHGVYAGFISYMDQKFWAGALCHPYRSVDEAFVFTKFLYYYLKCVEQQNMRRFVRLGGIPVLNKLDADRFVIPIPPLSVQQEIVRILDTFQELERELERELELRKKQFEYYRDRLLTFPEKAVN